MWNVVLAPDASGGRVSTVSRMEAAPYVVETAGLTKRFGDRVAVDGVDLAIPRGSAFGYLGPNGGFHKSSNAESPSPGGTKQGCSYRPR